MISLTLTILRSFHYWKTKLFEGTFVCIIVVLNIYNIILYSNYSGGVDLIFRGRDLNVVQTKIVVDIVAVTTGVSVMSYSAVSVCHGVLIEYKGCAGLGIAN